MAQDTRQVPGGHSGQPLTPEQARRLRDDRRFRGLMGAGAGVLAVVLLVGTLVVAHAQHPERPLRWPLVIGLGVAMLAVFVSRRRLLAHAAGQGITPGSADPGPRRP